MSQLKDREKVALKERDKAQKALTELTKAKTANDELLSAASSKAIQKARSFFDKKDYSAKSSPRSFQNAAAELKGAALANPTHPRLWLALGNFFFKIQNFQEALDAYSKTTEANQTLIKLAKKYSPLLGKDKMLSPENFQQIIHEFKGDEYFKSKFATDLIHFYFAKENSANKRGQVLLTVLKTWNPSWQVPIFKFQKKSSNHLTIGGSGLKRLIAYKTRLGKGNILSLLNITHIKIINSDLIDFSELKGLNLISVDISQSNINQLKGLKDLKTVTSLIIKKGQFPDLSDLPKTIQITNR